MQLTGGASYSTTYAIRVSALYNGTYLPYGNSCNITTQTSVPTTKLVSSICGTTLTSLYSSLFAEPVALATGYRFEVSNGGITRTYDSKTNVFNLMQLTGGVLYNTTYSVRVAAFYNGSYQVYDKACNVTTPVMGVTQLVASACGTTLTSPYAPLYANVVNLALGYRFEVTGEGVTRTYDSATNFFNLMQLNGGVALNTTYAVRVAALYNGAYQAYGESCNVSTPIMATAQLIASNCGITTSSLYSVLSCNTVTLATGYRFEVTNGESTRTYDSVTNTFNLMQLVGGAGYGTTYSIRVAPLYNGIYQSYGTTCNVTTPSIPTSKVSSPLCGSTLPSRSSSIVANAVTLATGYRFEVTNGGTTRTYDSATTIFNLMQVTGGAAFSTTYSIRVAPKYNGTEQAYGTSSS
jgi:hypothetical protein